MARPVTREVVLKSGFYIEVCRTGTNKGIMIRRETYDQMMTAYNKYDATMYDVKVIGEIKKGKKVKS